MNEEQHRLFVKELRLERDSLKAELNRIQLEKSKEELRQIIKEALTPKDNEQPTSKTPIFFSQPTQTEIETEVIDLTTLLKKASQLAILRERIKK